MGSVCVWKFDFKTFSFITTTTIIYVIINKVISGFNRHRVMNHYVMTIKEILSWIPNKIFILSDKYLFSRIARNKIKWKKGSSRKYYIRGTRNKPSRIASKRRHELFNPQNSKPAKYKLSCFLLSISTSMILNLNWPRNVSVIVNLRKYRFFLCLLYLRMTLNQTTLTPFRCTSISLQLQR